MSNLSLISHHLFVSAVRNESDAGVQQPLKQPSRNDVFKNANDIPLEVLDCAKCMPPTAMRPLRASMSGGS